MKDLRSKAKEGLLWDISGSFSRHLSTFVISVVLARILTPAEFGVVGMAMVFIGLTNVFIDVGFTEGIIQAKECSERVLSTIFYINLFLSVILACVLYFSSSLIGSFYGEPKVEEILVWLSVIPIFAAMSKVHSALLMREMNFKVLTIRTLIATVVAGVIGIFLAIQGMGVYSIVVQQISFTIIAALVLWTNAHWYPKLLFSYSEAKSIFNFSKYVFTDQLLRQVFNRLNTLFVGKMFSASTLGLFSRAESINTLFSEYSSNSLRKVMYPVLSKLQNDDKKFVRAFNQASSISSIVASFIAGILFIFSETIIVGLLGKDWYGSVVIFQILSFAVIVAPHIGLISKALLSKGYAKVKYKVGLIQRVILLTPIPIGYLYGIVEFTVSIVVAKYIILWLYIIVSKRKLKLSLWTQAANVIFPVTPFILVIFINNFIVSIEKDWLMAIVFVVAFISYLFYFRQETLRLILSQFNRSTTT